MDGVGEWMEKLSAAQWKLALAYDFCRYRQLHQWTVQLTFCAVKRNMSQRMYQISFNIAFWHDYIMQAYKCWRILKACELSHLRQIQFSSQCYFWQKAAICKKTWFWKSTHFSLIDMAKLPRMWPTCIHSALPSIHAAWKWLDSKGWERWPHHPILPSNTVLLFPCCTRR